MFALFAIKGNAQNPELTEFRASQLETLSEKKDNEPEDDTYETDMENFRRHPLNINAATEEDLIQLHLLNAAQVRNFFAYSKLLGPLLSLHELQAVPGWDLETIRLVLPYILVGRDESLYSAMRDRWKGGDATLLIRTGRIIEKSSGYDKPLNPGAEYYTGSPMKLFLRYTYNYKQLMAFGFGAEKDAGEPFFRGSRRDGFDFYSFHFFMQRLGIIRALAIGDITVNMGQGLIQWQTISFTKSSQVSAIKREAPCIRPYHSAGEFNFHRGLGISLQKGKWEGSFFISSRKISTNLKTDTAGREEIFSSFENSGYHRTPAEIADRNNNLQVAYGGNIRFSGNQFMVGFNCIYFNFKRSFQKRDEPYNVFSLKGNKLADYSIDYSFSRGNLYLFGEFAIDNRRSLACVHGALISMNEKINLVFLYRNISPSFQSLYSDAFTESSLPNNEKGLYAGLTWRPVAGLQLNLYYDLYLFPWLKYKVDAPSAGRELMIHSTYQPAKIWHFSTLYKYEIKTGNTQLANVGTHGLETVVKQRWRIDTEYLISRTFSFSSRMEFVWMNVPRPVPAQGFLGMAGFSFRKSGISGNMAVTVFETSDYDTRIYAYEQDLLYNFSLPAYFGKGIHYYINLHRDFSRMKLTSTNRLKLQGWIKWGQTFYPGTHSIGSGLDKIAGNRKSEIKMQVLVQWRQ